MTNECGGQYDAWCSATILVQLIFPEVGGWPSIMRPSLPGKLKLISEGANQRIALFIVCFGLSGFCFPALANELYAVCVPRGNWRRWCGSGLDQQAWLDVRQDPSSFFENVCKSSVMKDSSRIKGVNGPSSDKWWTEHEPLLRDLQRGGCPKIADVAIFGERIRTGWKSSCGRDLPRGHGPSLSARVLRLHEFGGFGGRCPLERMTFKEGLSKPQRQYGV